VFFAPNLLQGYFLYLFGILYSLFSTGHLAVGIRYSPYALSFPPCLPCLPCEALAKVGVLLKESKERESSFVGWGLPPPFVIPAKAGIQLFRSGPLLSQG